MLYFYINKRYIFILHRPERKMRQNTVMSCIFYNYVSGSLLDEPLLTIAVRRK